VAIRGARVQVTDQPTPLNTNEAGDPTPGRDILIRNLSAVTLDLGGPDVVSGDGFPLDPDDATNATLEGPEVLYAVAPDAGPYEVAVLRSGVV
jgi:hypothetical protein